MEPDFDALFARAHVRPREPALPRLRLRHWAGAFLMLAALWAVCVLPEALAGAAADHVAEEWGQ